ncbi:Bacterial type II secretion system protein F domain protein [compost metagenome]
MIAFLILAIGIGGIVFALGGLAGNPQEAAIDGRLSQLAEPNAPTVKPKLFNRLGALVDPLVKGLAIAKRLDRQLYQVGWAWTPGEFMLASGLLGLASGAMAFFLFQHPLIALAVAAVGTLGPTMQLRQRRTKTLKAFSEQLPDALMLVINALKAGNSFLQAIQMVSRQMSAPISTEFGTAVAEINFGVPTETALRNLRDRVGTIDVDLMVQAMVIQRETGGNLSEILGNIHDTIRDRIRIAGEVQALTAQGRMSGWVLACLPVGIGALFFLISPSYIMGLFSDPRGQMLVAGGVVSEILGVMLIMKIVDVRY